MLFLIIFFSIPRILRIPNKFLLAERDVLRHMENFQVNIYIVIIVPLITLKYKKNSRDKNTKGINISVQ